MTRLRTFVFRLWALLRARRMDRDIDDEIASHLAEATESPSDRAFPLTTHAGPLGVVSVA